MLKPQLVVTAHSKDWFFLYGVSAAAILGAPVVTTPSDECDQIN
jgi:hypothetical protein